MAQDLESIVELLREMQNTNRTSSESFDKVLSGISNKLKTIDQNSISEDLLKDYLNKLSRTMDEKYSTTILKFTDIENAIKALFSAQEEHVKNKDMKELFDIFTKSLNNFYSEERQQKAILAGIETRITEISSDKSDKEDIVRTITLLRNDFENLNHSYKNAIDNVSSDLKTILSSMIKLEQTNINDKVSGQIDIIYKASSDIVNYLNSIEKKESNLEKLISETATSESLKLTQGFIDTIIKNTQEISVQIQNLADKSDIAGLQNAAAIFNNKIDQTATKELFSKINKTTDEIISQTEEVKQILADVTKNIENIPDTNLLEDALHNLYKKLDTLKHDITQIDTRENVKDISNKISNLEDELSTIKNIVIDLNEALSVKIFDSINKISFEDQSYEIKNHVSKMLAMLPQKEDIDRILENYEQHKESIEELLKKNDIIADRLDSLPDHNDMDTLNQNQLSLVENLQEVANKTDIESLSSKTDEIEEMIDNLNFDNEFERIYDKTSSIGDWLLNSKIKENSEEILSKIPEKGMQKDVLDILNTSKRIANDLEELSKNTDVKKVKTTVADVYSMIEELKIEFINTVEIRNDSIIVILSELQKSVSEILTADDFERFTQDLKAFVNNSIDNHNEISTDLTSIKEYQNAIIEKLNKINFDNLVEVLNNSDNVRKEENTKLSEYIESILEKTTKNVDTNILEIKEILENNKSEIHELEKASNKAINNIDKYIQEIKNIFEVKGSFDNYSDLEKKLNNIENKVSAIKTFNTEDLSQIISKFEDLQITASADNKIPSANLEESFKEIKEIKEQLNSLGETFNSLDFEKGSDKNNAASFISEKLAEISNDLSNTTECFDEKLQAGFAYNAELIEEKTSLLLKLIKELRHNNSDDIGLYERLTVADNKLIDCKQELELVNTDIINGLNAKNEQLLQEIVQIKELIANTMSSQAFQPTEELSSIKEELDVFHETIQDDLAEYTKYSKSTYDKIEDIYTKISNEITANETNIRDFILNDIDSVLIKIDNLKSDLEESLNIMTPPTAEQMAEYQSFAGDISLFKKTQKALLAETAQDIKSALSEQMNRQHEELKSLLSVSINNKEIIEAINNLQNCFAQKFELAETPLENSDFAANEFEQEFETEKINSKVLDELKNDFDNFSKQIEDLSDKNPEILEVLTLIKNKLNSIDKNTDNVPEDIDISEILVDENKNTDNFDIVKALDLLKQDIEDLNKRIGEIIPQDAQLEVSETLTNTKDNSNLSDFDDKIDQIVQIINNEWAKQIKEYLADSEIKSMLELINNKIDILAQTDSQDWIDEIRDTLTDLLENNNNTTSNEQIQTTLDAINNKIDILATVDHTDDIEDIKFILDTIDSKLNETSDDSDKKLSDSDAKITKMLETLNHKIDILASADNSETISALDEVRDLILYQQDNLEKLDNNSNTETFKKCLEELSTEVNNINSGNSGEIQKSLKDMKESIMSAVVSIFEQVSFIEETEDIKDFVEEKTDEINKSLEFVTQQLKQITNTSEDPDYTYSMQDIESDLAKLRMALSELKESENEAQNDQLTYILDNINQIGSSVAGLQNSISDKESFNIINEGLAAFGQNISTKFDNVTQLLEKSHNSDKVMRQALIYMGEWIDSASISMNKISTNSDEIIDVKQAINSLKSSIPEQTEILNSLEEKFNEQQERLAYFEKHITKISNIENRFEEQQERIDRLESSIERILNAVEEFDDSKVTRKIDKIDKQLVKLSSNIEKLASYVDE